MQVQTVCHIPSPVNFLYSTKTKKLKPQYTIPNIDKNTKTASSRRGIVAHIVAS